MGIGGLGASAACGGGSERARETSAPGHDPAPPREESRIEETPIACQGAQSPLLFHGGYLLQATGTQIRLRDAKTLAEAGVLDVPTANLCPLTEGVVAALLPPAAGSIEGAIARIDLATRSVETFKGTMTTARGATLLAAGPEDVYLSAGDKVDRFHLHAGTLERRGRIDLPRRPAIPGRLPSEQIAILPDGRLIYPTTGALVLLAPGGAKPLSIPEPAPMHIATASGGSGLIWYTEYRTGRLILADPTDPIRVQHRVDLGDPIVHLAAGPGAAAVILSHDAPALRCELAVIEENGTVRWRAPLPAALANRDRPPFAALSAARAVAVAAFDPDRIAARDAAGGRPIAVAAG